MSRPSFRARPIDIAQALAIVRDESVLNDESQAVAREVTHAHKNLDKDNEEVRRPRPFPRAPPLSFHRLDLRKSVVSGSKIESPPRPRIWPTRGGRDSIPPVFSAPPDTPRAVPSNRVINGAIVCTRPRRDARVRRGFGVGTRELAVSRPPIFDLICTHFDSPNIQTANLPSIID